MLYLASVQRKLLPRSLGLKLLAVKRQDGLWRETATRDLIAVPPNTTDLADERLVVVSLSPKREVVNIVSAATALPLILQQLSGHIFKLQKSEEEIETWKRSLEFQSAELGDRKEAVLTGEESLKVQQELFAIEKDEFERSSATLESDRAALDAELTKFRSDRDALQTAWESVRLEQKRLKDS